MSKCKCEGRVRWRNNLGGYMPCVKAPPTTEYVGGKGNSKDPVIEMSCMLMYGIFCFAVGIMVGALL